MNYNSKWSDLIWGYLAQAMNVGAGVLILPVLLKKLLPSEVSIWFVLMTVSSLILMMDFGFAPTVTRSITFLLSGSRKLTKTGFVEISSSSQEDLDEESFRNLSLVLKTAKKIYSVLSVGAFLFLMTVGLLYFWDITGSFQAKSQAFWIWFLYVLASVIGLYFNYLSALLIGSGKLRQSYKILIVSRLVFIGISILGLYYGLGLLSLVLGSGLMTVTTRALTWHYLQDVDYYKKIVTEYNLTSTEVKKTFATIWHNAKKSGLVALGSFMATRSSTLIAAKYLGLDQAASFALTQQLYTTLMSVSLIAFSNAMPRMSSYFVTKNYDSLRREIIHNSWISITTFSFGVLVIVLWGNEILKLVGSQTLLLPTSQILFMGLYLVLDLNHSNFTMVLSSRNEIPFVKASLVSGVAIVLLSILFFKSLTIGIWSLLLAQFIVQLIYNNWKWPLVVLKALNLKIKDFILP